MSEIPKDPSSSKSQPDPDQTKETVFIHNKPAEAHTSLPETDATVRVTQPRLQMAQKKYKIMKELGKGGFAWVYLVKNLDLNRLEAIKILNADLTMEEDVCNRFVKEAQISANFNHQNIVTIFEVQRGGYWSNFEVEETIRNRHAEPFVYFTMSFVEGNTSTNLIRKSTRIPQKQALRIVMDTCNALNYAHSIGVVHRDIKPDNIIVDRRGSGIVMDFGIAKVVDQTRQTAAGTFMGTARYVSPEQALGREIDGRSDLYSLGITLYELVTGRVPFDSEEWMTVLYAHVNEQPPSPDRFYADIDRDLRAIILKMLEKKPENRFQTAKETHDALARVYMKLGGPAVHTEAIEKIGTRPNLVSPIEDTVATEIVRTQAAKVPPSRVRQKPPSVVQGSTDAAPPSNKKPLMIGVAALALVAIIAFFVLSREKPKPDPDPKPPPAMVKSQLLITAFPKGRLIRLQSPDHSQDSLEYPKGELPLLMTLPEGNYELIIEYGGQTKKTSVFISDSIPQSKAHVEFEIEDDLFLMEDLR